MPPLHTPSSCNAASTPQQFVGLFWVSRQCFIGRRCSLAGLCFVVIENYVAGLWNPRQELVGVDFGLIDWVILADTVALRGCALL